MRDTTCHQQCPAVFRTGLLFILSRGNRNRAFPPPYKQSAPPRPRRAVRRVNYLYERISRVICTFPLQLYRAQIPHSSRNQAHSKKAKQTLPIRPEMPKRTALLVCNFLSGRAETPSRTERKIRVFGTVSAIHTLYPKFFIQI